MLSKERIRRILNYVFKPFITAVAVYIVLRKIDLSALWAHIQDARLLYLLIALIVLWVSKIAEAVRLNVFLRKADIRLGEWENFRLYLLGMFYNLFLPGGVGGDGYKVYWLNRNRGARVKTLIWLSLLNRANGLFGLIILLLVSVLFISYNLVYNAYLILLIPFLYAGYYLVLRWFFQAYTSTLPKTTLLSVIIQFLQVVSAHFILVSLGLGSSYPDYWFLFLLSGILFAVPVTLGGFGSRELVFVYASQYLFVDVNLAVALGLLTYVLRAIISLSGVYFVMFPDKIVSGRVIDPAINHPADKQTY